MTPRRHQRALIMACAILFSGVSYALPKYLLDLGTPNERPCAEMEYLTRHGLEPNEQYLMQLHAKMRFVVQHAEDVVFADDRPLTIHVLDRGRSVAEFDFILHNQSLRLDLEINPGYRGQGLYSDILNYALRAARAAGGTVNDIPSIMVLRKSDNARVAFGLLADKLMYKINQQVSVWQKFTPQELIEWRTRIINATYSMPAVKARGRNGFKHLGKSGYRSCCFCRC